jgi:adenosylcobyric acid synthase
MKAIMLQGTGSDVGKSVVATAFCRYFSRKGFSIAPFKSQNMALNSYVTTSGGEIGRAQGVQAEAAGIEATVDMNPILLKPKGEQISEVIIHGKHYADLEVNSYRAQVFEILKPVKESLQRLSQKFDVLVIEGAGSPAEINLKDRDIANMRVAHLADAPVLLVADIERGGVFASIVGTLALLEPEEKARIKGVIINKFRGRRELLDSGIDWLERKTGLPVLGVLPYVDLDLDPEDSMALDQLQLKDKDRANAEIEIAIIRLPRISNFTDFIPLEKYSGLKVRYVKSIQELSSPDLILLPGTKNTMEDLVWLQKSGLADRIKFLRDQGKWVVGICGGYQMLGEQLIDPATGKSVPGLGLLALTTHFQPTKTVTKRQGRILVDWAKDIIVEGYEIHLGQTELSNHVTPFACLTDGSLDGAKSDDGKVWGSYLHGIFDEPRFTLSLINRLRKQKGLSVLSELPPSRREERNKVYEQLADWIEKYLDMKRVEKILFGSYK